MDMSCQNMIMEIITIYRKMKKGRENQNIYRSLLNVGCNVENSEAEEFEPSVPFFKENNEKKKNTSVYDFARIHNIRDTKYIYFSQNTTLIQSNTLFDNNFDIKERLLSAQSSPSNSNKKSGFYWINIFDPNENDLKVLAETYGIHDISIIDIREKNTEEKIEIFKHYTFISLKLFSFSNGSNDDYENNDYINEELGNYTRKSVKFTNFPTKKTKKETEDIDFNILLFKDFIITTHDKKWVGINDILNFLSLIGNHSDLFPDWVLYSVIIEFLQDLKYIKEEIKTKIDFLRDVSTAHEGNIEEILRGNFALVYQLHNLRNTIKPKISILNNLKSKCKKRMRKNVLMYLKDVHDDFKIQEKEIQQCNKILERCQDLCLAIVGMTQSKEGNAMNKSMKWFTLITFVFLPTQTVAGIWGMNVKVPGQDTKHLWWFWGLCLLGPIISLIYFYGEKIFKSRKKLYPVRESKSKQKIKI